VDVDDIRIYRVKYIFRDCFNFLVKNKAVVLSVGFFIQEKQIDQLISAACALSKKYGNSFTVLIIGSGPLENFYKEIIQNNKAENQIHIVGQVPPDKIMSYYSVCDFVVHPSVIEGFSMVCLEAMSAGKPFICTENIGITEYIKPNREAFIVPPNDVGALIQKMEMLLKNPKLREKMGRAAHQTALKFRWENHLDKFLKVYSNFASTEGL